jgi:hypothetical protein
MQLRAVCGARAPGDGAHRLHEPLRERCASLAEQQHAHRRQRLARLKLPPPTRTRRPRRARASPAALCSIVALPGSPAGRVGGRTAGNPPEGPGRASAHSATLCGATPSGNAASQNAPRSGSVRAATGAAQRAGGAPGAHAADVSPSAATRAPAAPSVEDCVTRARSTALESARAPPAGGAAGGAASAGGSGAERLHTRPAPWSTKNVTSAPRPACARRA